MNKTFRIAKTRFVARKLASAFSSVLLTPDKQGFNDLCEALGWNERNWLIPPIKIEELGLTSDPVRIREVGHRSYNVTIEELVLLARLTATQKPSVIFELGTFDGRSTLNLMLNAPTDARIYTIDLPQERQEFPDQARVGQWFEDEKPNRVVQLFGDTRTFDFTPFYGTSDLIFIDASHESEFVENDSNIAVKLLRSDAGIIVWHDYASFPGVSTVLNKLYQQGGIFKRLRRVVGTSMAILLPKPSS